MTLTLDTDESDLVKTALIAFIGSLGVGNSTDIATDAEVKRLHNRAQALMAKIGAQEMFRANEGTRG
jgi:hypothetical protein